jgi:hypothetical protein
MKQTLALVLAILIVGCASNATPMRKIYVTISDATAGATAAMGAFNDRYQNGLQTEADRTKVLAYWADFQATAHAAETLAKDITQQASALTIASDAASKLIALIAALVPAKAEIYSTPWNPIVPQYQLLRGAA